MEKLNLLQKVKMSELDKSLFDMVSKTVEDFEATSDENLRGYLKSHSRGYYEDFKLEFGPKNVSLEKFKSRELLRHSLCYELARNELEKRGYLVSLFPTKLGDFNKN